MKAGDAENPDHNRDTVVAVRGPAVAGLRGAFARVWAQTPYALVTAADRFPAAQRHGTSAVQVVCAQSVPGWNDVVRPARRHRRAGSGSTSS
ncbi:MAG: hypothetical protein L0H64_20460 [Pseudonocardia sp.]|nr:hypothetical protein [Pseudonocardia sp.]